MYILLIFLKKTRALLPTLVFRIRYPYDSFFLPVPDYFLCSVSFQSKHLDDETFNSIEAVEEYGENTISSLHYLLLESLGNQILFYHYEAVNYQQEKNCILRPSQMGIGNGFWFRIQVNLDVTDSMGPGKLVRHMHNPSGVIHIWHILDMHGTGTKHLVRHRRKSVLQWSVISKFTCIGKMAVFGSVSKQINPSAAGC